MWNAGSGWSLYLCLCNCGNDQDARQGGLNGGLGVVFLVSVSMVVVCYNRLRCGKFKTGKARVCGGCIPSEVPESKIRRSFSEKSKGARINFPPMLCLIIGCCARNRFLSVSPSRKYLESQVVLSTVVSSSGAMFNCNE